MLAIAFLISLGIATSSAHKILMTGSLERSEHAYFEQVGAYFTKAAAAQNTVYLLSHEQKAGADFEIKQISDRFFSIQVPKLPGKPGQSPTDAQIARIGRFFWNSALTEEENYVNLDIEHAECYFATDAKTGSQPLLEFLKSQKFDLGIGGTYNADSLLYRALGLDFLKISAEDIESYQMQFKFKMPVLLSAYPSSLALSNHFYDDVPDYDDARYRLQFNRGYMYNMLIGRPLYMKRLRAAIPEKFHAEIIDAFDQDHAMILGEGTKAGIFQSIMMKPPNVQPVYPLRDESEETRTTINLDAAKKGPVIIFNTEIGDPKSLLYQDTKRYLAKMVKQLNKLEAKLGSADFDVVFLTEEKNARRLNVAISGQEVKQFLTVTAVDPLNIEFSPETAKSIKDHKRPVLWMSQCTQLNFLTAIEKFRAAIVGFANEELSQTQAFNCHKLLKFSVGKPISIDSLDNEDSSKTLVVDTIHSLLEGGAPALELSNLHSNVTFFGRLLAEDERLSRMDLEYWVDYVQLFGVKDMIPLYDHMDPITYRNWDVYVFLWSLLFLVLFIFYKILCCCKYIICCKFMAKAEHQKVA